MKAKPHRIKELDVDSWEAFEETLQEIRKSQENTPGPPAGRLLFRGQENSAWALTTTLERCGQLLMRFEDYYRLISRVKPQIESFTGDEWPIPDYPAVLASLQGYDKFSLALTFGELPAYAYMVYMRHHGFPSPLLDWTRSPYVAAYFAFSRIGSTGNCASIYVWSEPSFLATGTAKAQIVRLGPYVRTHQRHFLQQCEYTMCVIFDNEWRFDPYESLFEPHNQQGQGFWKINIPLTERMKVLKLLDDYNLNAFSLFNSQESLMETMAFRELHRRSGVP